MSGVDHSPNVQAAAELLAVAVPNTTTLAGETPNESTLQIFDALDAATEAALRASIEKHGVLVPVAIDQDGRIIDGHHRVRIADELGKPYKTIEHWAAGDFHAKELARTLNEDRRQLPIAERRQVVADLREQGHSLRAIGGALGVSKDTVAKDVEQVSTPRHLPEAPKVASIDTNLVSVDTTPERVTGTDGKSYPAKRQMPELDPAEKARRARESQQFQAHLNLTNALIPLNPDPIEPERFAQRFADALAGRLIEFEAERLEKAAVVLLAMVEIRRSM